MTCSDCKVVVNYDTPPSVKLCARHASVDALVKVAQAVIDRWDAPIGNVTGQEDPEYGAPMSKLRAALAEYQESGK